MLAVKAHQYTADVLPLTTPHIYTVPQDNVCSDFQVVEFTPR